MHFENKTALITGASRGIGKAIALTLASKGANIIIAAKSTEENPKLGGTIYSAADEIKEAGGNALPLVCDIRSEEQIITTVEKGIAHFGGIDILVNNASAIQLTNTNTTESKRYDLMQAVNVRGTYLMSKHCIPALKKATNAHILTLAPPINLNPKWFKDHLAYTISKYSMSMIALGLAEELKPFGIASNTLWPKTTIATAAVNNLLGGEALMRMSRTPDIVADAALEILSKSAKEYTGQSCIDEEVLRIAGVTNVDHYAYAPGQPLYPDLFLDD
ncbi:MAG: SDR family oxidoreductase [Ferruginibacter sp.]